MLCFHHLQASRKISYKDLVKDCLSLIGDLSHDQTELTREERANGTFSVELRKDSHGALELALPEVEKSTCLALKKLLQMVTSYAIFCKVYFEYVI